MVMSSSIPRMRNLTLSSKGSPHNAFQSGQDGGHRSNTSTSHRSQGGGGGTDFRDKQVAVDGSLSKKHAA